MNLFRHIKSSFFLVITLLTCVFSFSYAYAATDDETSGDLPVPRFVSIRASEANARVGPDVKFPIRWVYNRAHMPVEVIQDYEGWRKIRDIDGAEGWIHRSLLSGKRRVIINIDDSEKYVFMHRKPNEDSSVIAKLENKVIADLDECSKGWCEITTSGIDGWVEGKFLWGIYHGKELY